MVKRKPPVRLQQSSLLYWAVFALLALVGWGCSNASSPSSGPSGQQAGSKSSAPADSNDPSDESLTSEEYILLGLPAQDREWSGDDMVNAEKVLTALAQKEYRQLPRYKSKRSGEVFARLTSPENLDLYKNRTLPLDARFPQAASYFQATGRVLKVYFSGFLKNDVRDSELVELIGAQLRSTVVILDLVDESLVTIPKDDPKYQIRMQGLEKMGRGLASVVAGGLQMLTEHESYRTSVLARLVDCMQETFPQIVPRLPPGARAETLIRLEKMQEDPELNDLQPGLGELRSKVRASVEKTKDP